MPVVTRGSGSHAESSLNLGVPNTLALTEFGQARVNLRQKHEPLDRVIHGGVSRQNLQGLEDSVPRHACVHNRRILALGLAIRMFPGVGCTSAEH